MAKKKRARPKTLDELARELKGKGPRVSIPKKEGRSSNIIKARIARRQKLFRKKSAAAKRTKVAQFSVKDLKLVRPKVIKSAKTKIVGRKAKITRRATVHMKRASLFRVSGEGAPKVRAKRILTDPEGFPVSPRGRPMIKGVTDPFQKPPEDQPQGVQDYFLGSRAIRRRAYDPSTGTLEVVFTTGYGYHFFDVPYSVWLNWLKAQSAGRFFMTQIYGYWSGKKGSKTYHPNYNYTRIQ